jgi:serine/threonine-protein kinase
VATFGRYEILDKLGEGAMGVVYRARDPALNRVVALKMLSAELGGEEELHQRFQREAEAIGRLSHPNIVTVYDLGQAEGQLYMSMELLEGDDLRKLIEQRMDIPLPDRVRLLLQIVEGLAYAHSRDVVHRDVKPANIVVTSKGRVKLLDFGLARVASQSNITRRGVILGTPDYMSPEQAMGRSVTHRSDQFAAGAVFYEFLSGNKPFRGKSLHSVLYQILSEEPEPLLSANPRLPARLAAVVHGMMRKDPERRYPSMEDVRRELADIHLALRCGPGPGPRQRGGSRTALAGRAHPARRAGRARARSRARGAPGRAAGPGGGGPPGGWQASAAGAVPAGPRRRTRGPALPRARGAGARGRLTWRERGPTIPAPCMPASVDREKRLGLHLPLEVSGVDASGQAFTDSTRSVNISGGGICFECSRHLLVGSRLLLQIQLPPALQKRFGGREVYRVRAVVCREESFEGETVRRIGARFLGESEDRAGAARR